MNILVVNGSPRADSNSKKVTAVVVEAFKLNQVMPTVVDLHEFKLPLFEGYVEYGDQVKEWSDKVAKADGILFISPEYHGFIPGALKNAIDFIRTLEDKVIGLITVSAGQGGHFAHNALMQICRNMGAWIVPLHAVVNDAKNAFVDGDFRDPKIKERIGKLCEKVVNMSRLLKKS